ncbi:hypothetical protein BANRA_00016 [Escherichia coli]|nr:hypothetical protein BANRA_00016 [Escherichia coli]
MNGGPTGGGVGAPFAETDRSGVFARSESITPVNMASIFMPKEAASQPPKMAKPAPRNPQAGILIHKIPVNMKGQKVPGI